MRRAYVTTVSADARRSGHQERLRGIWLRLGHAERIVRIRNQDASASRPICSSTPRTRPNRVTAADQWPKTRVGSDA
jgi:hypothetical protein